MGWSWYEVACSVNFTVDCHGGPREVEEEALYAEAKARLLTAWGAVAQEVIDDPKYAAIKPELNGLWGHE